MSKKNIWIINEYAGSPLHGMTYRHYYLSRELVKLGYNVTIITSAFSHYTLKKHIQGDDSFFKTKVDEINYIWVSMPKYSSSKSIGRIRNWFLFAIKLLFLPFLKLEKPDFIYVSSLPLHPVIPGYLLSKHYKAKLIFEVRDIWPLSAVELGGYSTSNPFIKHLQWLEDFAYKKADQVVSVLPNAYEHMKTRGLSKSKFHYISNGILLEDMLNIELLDENVKKKIPKDKFIVGYVGTLGIANALEYFIDAAILLNENKDILFVIVGDGPSKSDLKQKAKKLDNILFINSIPKQQVQSLLKLFDLCYIGWHKRSIYQYGISANKIFDYMYSAKPILHSINMSDDLVFIANCGVSKDAESSVDIAEGIIELYNMNQDQRDILGQNGKNYVLKNYTYEKLAKKMAMVLEK